MPNHVTNKLRFENIGDDLWVHICKVLQGDDPERSYGSVDFNVLIPMPKALNIESGSRGENGYRAYKEFLRESAGLTAEQASALERQRIGEIAADPDRTSWELGKKYYENEQKYGFTTWYGWCNAHWGTKWNAYDSSRDDYGKELTFLTAWSHPEPVVREISRRFPDVLIRHGWADEDVGYNVGEMTWLGGECIDENIPSGGSQDALKLFAEIMDESLEDYGYEYVNGLWIFEEER